MTVQIIKKKESQDDEKARSSTHARAASPESVCACVRTHDNVMKRAGPRITLGQRALNAKNLIDTGDD